MKIKNSSGPCGRGNSTVKRNSVLLVIRFAALVVVATAGCAVMTAGPQSDLARTWEYARVYLPETGSYERPSGIAARERTPTVVFLHDCAGIDDGAARWAATLATAGFAVVVPDSFARQGRRSDCDPRTGAAGLFPDAERMRREEARHALWMLRAAHWADGRNLFLMGHGEGGRAAAQWTGPGFKALIISGSRCPDGIRASLDTPVLAISFERDPWTKGDQSGCSKEFEGRGQASELRLTGSGHDTSSSTEAQGAVLTFLRYHTSR